VSRAALALLLLLALPPVAARALDRPLRVFVAAPRNFLLDEARIFRPRGERLPHDATLKEVARQVEVQLGKKAWIDVANAQELARGLAGSKEYGDGLVLGREWLNLGQEHYESLRVDEAIVDLRRAEDLYLQVFHDVVEPYAFARVFLLQGLCYVERGLKGQSHVAFRRMFFQNPGVRFEPGYYPPHAEEEIRSSAVDFVLTHPKENPFLGEDRLEKFFDAYPFDYLVHVYLDGASGQALLHLVVLGREGGDPVLHESFPLPADEAEGEAASVGGAVDAALSRWLTCQDLTPAPATQARAPGIGFRVSSHHSTYLKTPSRSLFYSYGYGLGVFYDVNRWLELIVAYELYTSIVDRYRDLQHSFNTVRGLVGVAFRFGGDRVHAVVSPAFEIHYLGDFQIVTDPFCKLYGSAHPACNQDAIFSLNLDLLLGMNVSASVRFYLTKHVFLELMGSISTYFLPMGRNSELNFPVSGGIGLGYRL